MGPRRAVCHNELRSWQRGEPWRYMTRNLSLNGGPLSRCGSYSASRKIHHVGRETHSSKCEYISCYCGNVTRIYSSESGSVAGQTISVPRSTDMVQTTPRTSFIASVIMQSNASLSSLSETQGVSGMTKRRKETRFHLSPHLLPTRVVSPSFEPMEPCATCLN